MTALPAQPKIYHITHIDNLASILTDGCLESDGTRFRHGGGETVIGIAAIKGRRLFENEVFCHPGTKVGDYVPFYFCPRSIMLYLLHMGNHPDITYHGGQRPLLHLQADMEEVISWAKSEGVRWAFSDRNAGTRFTSFYKKRKDLSNIDWNAVKATNWRDPLVREGKQAEFLIYEAFPWQLVEKIGVVDDGMRNQVQTIINKTSHKPIVAVERAWYY